MLIRSLSVIALFGIFTSVACGGGSSKPGSGSGGSPGGGGESGGGTGGKAGGDTFMAVAPCATEAAYETGTTIEFPGGDMMSYSPKCLKTSVETTITFMPMTGSTFSMFPLSPSHVRGNIADNAIEMTETNSATAKSFTFGLSGFYGYFCRKAGVDDDGTGMAGVIWVQ